MNENEKTIVEENEKDYSNMCIKVEPQYKVLLTVEETAGVFGIGENTLRKLIAKNPSANYLLRIGNKVLFKRDLFVEYINGESELC